MVGKFYNGFAKTMLAMVSQKVILCGASKKVCISSRRRLYQTNELFPMLISRLLVWNQPNTIKTGFYSLYGSFLNLVDPIGLFLEWHQQRRRHDWIRTFGVGRKIILTLTQNMCSCWSFLGTFIHLVKKHNKRTMLRHFPQVFHCDQCS